MKINKNYLLLGIFTFSLIGCSANLLTPIQIPVIGTQALKQQQVIQMPFNISFAFPSDSLHTQAIDKDRLEGLRFIINKSDNAVMVFDEIDLAYVDSYAANKTLTRTFRSLPNVMDVVGTDLVGGASGIYDKTTTTIGGESALIITKKTTTLDSTNVSGTFDIMPGNNNVITAEGLKFRRNSLGKILKKDSTLINGDGILQRDSLGYITGDAPSYEALQGIRVMGYFDAKAGENNSINVNWGRTPVAKIISMLRSSTDATIRNMAKDDILTSANRTALQNKFNVATGWAGNDKTQTFTSAATHPALMDTTTAFTDLTADNPPLNPRPTTEVTLSARIAAIVLPAPLGTGTYNGKIVLKDENGTIMANTEVKLWFGDASSAAPVTLTSDVNGIVNNGAANIFTNIIPSNATIYPAAPTYKMQAEITGAGTPTIRKGSKGINYANALTVNAGATDSSTIELNFANVPLKTGYQENLRGLTNKFDGTAAVSVDPVVFAAGVDDAVLEYTLPNAFTFKGTSYTKVWVHSNGALEFTTSTPASKYPKDPASTKPRDVNTEFTARNIIAPLWTDLELTNAAGGGIFAKGDIVPADPTDASNKHITFLWKARQKGIGNEVKFEVKLTLDNFGTAVVNPNTNDADSKGYIEFSYNNAAQTFISYTNPVLIGVAGNYSTSLQPGNWPTMGIKMPNTKQSMFFYYN